MSNQPYELRQIHCQGTPTEMGHAHGEQLRDEIRRFVAQRFDALEAYMSERNQLDIPGFLAVGSECLRIAEAWDPEGTKELVAIAEAANVDALRLFAAGNMTDLRDVVLLPSAASDEGCSALVVPPNLSADAQLYAAQTWDLNPTDLEFVVAVHRTPARGPESWSVTCTGCLSLMGMNGSGLTVGTTNIKAKDTRPGVGYLSLLHRALGTTNVAEAKALIETAPRAAAHTYWIADAEGAVELECGGRKVSERRLSASALTRTNHCMAPGLVELQGEPTSDSSAKRLEKLDTWLGRGQQNLATLQALFSDRSDGIDSINRYLEDDTGTSTNACMVGVPARRELWACRGPADRGHWVRLTFDRG